MCICDISVEDIYVRLPLSESASWVIEQQAKRKLGWRRFLMAKKTPRSLWRIEPIKDDYQVRFTPNTLPQLWWRSAESAAAKRL